MRIEIVTDSSMIGLGIGAKNIFIEKVLTVDELDGSYDTLQTVKNDTLEKITNLPLGAGFTQEIKDGMIRAFKKMEIGRKFLCLNKWVVNYQSDEAKFYWEVQRLCNEGHSLAEATALANDWLKDIVINRNEEEFDKQKNEILNHLSEENINPRPLIVLVNSESVKQKLEIEFQNELEKFTEFNDEKLFSKGRSLGLKVFKICSTSEYKKLNEVIKANSITSIDLAFERAKKLDMHVSFADNQEK